MNRVHLQLTFYIILSALIVSLGVLTYQTYTYRKAKEYITRTASTASYAAEIAYRSIKEDNGAVQGVAEEYYRTLTLISKPDTDIFGSFPILIVLSENGYYVYKQGNEIIANTPYDSEEHTLDYYREQESKISGYNEFTNLLNTIINNTPKIILPQTPHNKDYQPYTPS